MRWVIISDIHGNMDALLTAMPELERADRIYCLGDMVGYGPQPNECCHAVMEMKALSVLGNHDAAALDLQRSKSFNPTAREAIDWTAKVLDKESRQYLSSLDRYLVQQDAVFVHGSWNDPDDYIFGPEDAALSMERQPADVCFIGHTHRPSVFCYDAENRITVCEIGREMEMSLETGMKYLINPGSIGQPRDGDPRAAFMLYDTEERRIELHRREYDIPRVQEKMLNLKLPNRLIDRLERGL